MKKNYGDYSKNMDIIEKDYQKIDLKDDKYFGSVCLVDIKKVNNKWSRVNEKGEEQIILDEGYKWVTLYPKNENFALTAMLDSKLELVEFYFDIGKKVNFKAKVPYIEDLYLDVVITKENEVTFVDEEKLEEAYAENEIRKIDYELARKTADKIVNKFHRPEEFEKLKTNVRKYLENLINMQKFE